MWKYLLQAKQFHGYSFRRQRPILDFIVDFCCLELLLIIEVDGITPESNSAIEKDSERDQKLEEIGFSVLRFSSWEVLNKMVDIDVLLTTWLIKKLHPLPPPKPACLKAGGKCTSVKRSIEHGKWYLVF